MSQSPHLTLETFEEQSPPHRRCAAAGCQREGEFRAPRSPRHPGEYYWFCLDHVREYNAKYNYFEGMSEAEMEAARRRDVFWDRPTWRMGQRSSQSTGDPMSESLDGYGFFDDDFGDSPLSGLWTRNGRKAGGQGRRTHQGSRHSQENASRHRQRQQQTASPPGERLTEEMQALLTLDLPPSPLIDFDAIKARYKDLVKRYHPDANGGDKRAEERLKTINQAYTVLRRCAALREQV